VRPLAAEQARAARGAECLHRAAFRPEGSDQVESPQHAQLLAFQPSLDAERRAAVTPAARAVADADVQERPLDLATHSAAQAAAGHGTGHGLLLVPQRIHRGRAAPARFATGLVAGCVGAGYDGVAILTRR